MKHQILLALCLCFFPSGSSLAQTNPAQNPQQTEFDAALADYYLCLRETFKEEIKTVSEQMNIANVVVQKCKATRQALVSAHSQMTGDKESFSSKVVLSFETRIIGQEIDKYKESKRP